MKSKLQRIGLLVVYQMTVVLGIVMMPLALLARRAGVNLPIHRIIESVGRVYEGAAGR